MIRNSEIYELLDWANGNLYSSNRSYKNKLYFAKEIPKVKKNLFFNDVKDHKLKPNMDIIEKIKQTKYLEDADFVFVPHPWVMIRKDKDYLNYLNGLSKIVPLLIANTDDTTPYCDLPNTLELRTFLHPRENKFRKIILPYPAISHETAIRKWKNIPVVSFIGYVPKLSLGSLTSSSRSFWHSPIKTSVYINRKISTVKLKRLRSKLKIVCIERSQFTLSQDNSNLLYEQNIFRANLAESDYIVCPRGFGNTSIRFYETMSSGATPILVESGTELPFVTEKNFWDTNILTLNLSSNWAKNILSDWEYLSLNDNYLNRQKENILMFNNVLEIQKYLELLFKKYIKTVS